MSRNIFSMDMDWRFRREDTVTEEQRSQEHKVAYNKVKTGNIPGPAAKRAFDDSAWEQVNLPHDYIRETEFSPDANRSQGFHVLYDGWYRKTFKVDPSLTGKHAMLVFEGISTSSVIYLNGSVMERSFSLYSEIAVDVTDRLYFDRINTLAVFTRGSDVEGWWYEGAGIYRHVKLYVKDLFHIAHNGLWAKPVLCSKAENRWNVVLETTLENSGFDAVTGTVRARLYDGGRLISEASVDGSCGSDAQAPATCALDVENPIRWDVDNPKLYTLQVELLCGGEVIDTESTRIGFRTFSMDADKGFFLNDRPLKIKGTCNHQDHAGVGVAVPDSIQYYRIRRLKEMGCNAYRCAHNPPAREILDACDELGLIVMDENRTFETRPDAIKNLEILIRRDRNHPCVIFYSLFNEEPLQNTSEGRAIYKRLKSRVLKLDDTRLLTGAINDMFHPNGTGAEMDVLGKNYGPSTVAITHEQYPDKPIIGAENNSAVTTRGCYRTDPDAHVLSNYDEEKVPWGNTIRENWKIVRSQDFFSGIFVWTGFDYRGEPTPYPYPSHTSQFGIMDTCGFPKDAYYFTQAVFMDKPMLHILPHWNWTAGETVRVMTVTNAEEVELFLNGVSLGRRSSDPCEQNEWQIPFEPGTLSAVAYRGGKAVAFAEQKTAENPVQIKLTPDRQTIGNGGQDTVPVRVSVVDANGVEVPNADHLIHFTVEGDGFVAGVGNGNPNSMEADHLPMRKLYCGLCQVLVTAKLNAKQLKLVATADGLGSAEVIFDVQQALAPHYIYFQPNLAITGIQASVADSPERPDPKHVYSSDDNNSLAPIVLENSLFDNFAPSGFHTGWREYRIPVSLFQAWPKDKIPALEVASVICERAEIYIDGQLIFEAEPAYKSSMTIPLGQPKAQDFEVCVLLKAHPDPAVSSGFSVGITLSMLDS